MRGCASVRVLRFRRSKDTEIAMGAGNDTLLKDEKAEIDSVIELAELPPIHSQEDPGFGVNLKKCFQRGANFYQVRQLTTWWFVK